MIFVCCFLFKGSFCTTGCSIPQHCPSGTFSNSTGLKRSADCTPCPAGEYCAGFGQTKPTACCDAGFYCRQSAYTSVSVHVCYSNALKVHRYT